jgi:hypothetical protein
MTEGPDFDALLGDVLDDDAERERLRRIHELLVAAGPPPELSPELAAGPNVFAARRRGQEPPRWLRSRTSLIAAAALIGIAAFVAGSHSRGGNGFAAIRTVPLQPTAAATGASATIQIGIERNENSPMRLTATGLPDSTGTRYYAVFLTRHGKVVGPCGWFVVHNGHAVASLNAPYRLGGTGWIVTLQHRGERGLGRIVLST